MRQMRHSRRMTQKLGFEKSLTVRRLDNSHIFLDAYSQDALSNLHLFRYFCVDDYGDGDVSFALIREANAYRRSRYFGLNIFVHVHVYDRHVVFFGA